MHFTILGTDSMYTCVSVHVPNRELWSKRAVNRVQYRLVLPNRPFMNVIRSFVRLTQKVFDCDYILAERGGITRFFECTIRSTIYVCEKS